MMPANETTRVDPDAEVLRQRAVKRLNKRRDFYRHLVVYVVLNTLFVAIWATSSHHVFFWPAFIIAGWGIGVVFNGWDVFHGDEWTDRQIQREIDRLQGSR